MTASIRTFGFTSGGFDRRRRSDRRAGDRRRVSVSVPVDRRTARDRRSNKGRRITEWFNPLQENARPRIEVVDEPARETGRALESLAAARNITRNRSAPAAETFDTHTFTHKGRTYEIEAEERTDEKGRTGRRWLVMVDGVVEHTLRVVANERRVSLEARTIRAVEETAAGAVREIDFEYRGKRYHLEDRSDKLSRDSEHDLAMWCLTCDGVMEGSFPAASDESESVLRARAIEIARQSGEYQAALEDGGRRKSIPPPLRRSGLSHVPPRRTQPARKLESKRPPPSSVVKPRSISPVRPTRPTGVPKSPATPGSAPRPKTASTTEQRVRASGAKTAARGVGAKATVKLSTEHRTPPLWRAASAFLRGTYALLRAVATLPIRLFTPGPRPKTPLSRAVRRVQDWLQAMPIRMLLPYAVGAALVLGFVPWHTSAWAAGGMAIMVLLPLRMKRQPDMRPFSRQGGRRTSSAPTMVELHTKTEATQPRIVRRRRQTMPYRTLQSAARRY